MEKQTVHLFVFNTLSDGEKLGIYTTEALDAWYGLYKTGDPAYFFELQQLTA